MLTVLSMLGGKTIGKYIAIATAVAAVAFGMWLAVQSYNKAIAKAASVEIKLEQANTETEVANANTDKLASMYKEQGRQMEQARRLAHQRAISRQQATEALAGYLNSNSSADINRMLCDTAARIQGSPVAGCGQEMLATGEASIKSPHAASYVVTDSTVEAIHSALNQCGDYIESLEHNSIPNQTEEKFHLALPVASM